MRRIQIASILAVSLMGSAAAVAQEQTPVVAPLESRRTMVPAPKVGPGAPYYSSEQLDVERKQAARNIACIGNDARRRSFGSSSFRRAGLRGFDFQSKETRIANHARKAMNATIAAEDSRKRAAQGLASFAEVESTELRRQEAVRYYDFLLGRNLGLGYDPVVGSNYPVQVEVLSARIREEGGREWLHVAGQIHNMRQGRTLIPAVTLAIYDLDGNLTGATAARPTHNALAAGEARPFALRVPAWKDAARVEVRPGTLAPFMEDRNFCRPRAGADAVRAAREYEILQDDLRFNLPPNSGRRPDSAPIQRNP